MVDLSLKPTLASYPFRVQPDERPADRPIHFAEDGDDALLAMIESQVELSSKKLKMGEVRKAVNLLHKAYGMVESYVESFPAGDPLPPAAVLGAANVRIALCVVLSSAGRHAQALHEAKMAAREMDKTWRSLFLASAEQEEATADGDKFRPAPPFRDAFRNPPPWLERAVETAVQARHCIAIELEYEAGFQGKSSTSLFGGSSVTSSGIDVALSTEAPDGGLLDPQASLDESEVPDPVPASEAFTVQEQIGRLHREGVQLARQLLPANHRVRHRAELALEEWLQRTGGDGQPNLPPPQSPIVRSVSRRRKNGKHGQSSSPKAAPASSPLSRSVSSPQATGSLAPASKAVDSELPCITRMDPQKRLPPHAGSTWPVASMQTATASTASIGSMGLLGSETSRMQPSMSVGTFMSQLSFSSSAPGDVYSASLPRELPQLAKKRRPQPPRSPRDSRSPSKDRQGSKERRDGDNGVDDRNSSKQSAPSKCPSAPVLRRSKTPQQKAKEAALLLAQKDPFEDWRKNMVNEKAMSHFQRQLKSDEGLRDLQGGMKDEGRKFRLEMRRIDDDALYENRMKFGPAGLVVMRRAKNENEAFKNSNWAVTEEGQAKNSTKRSLFDYYHTSCAGEQPKLGDLGELLHKSHTHGANLNKLALQEKNRQEAERKRLLAERLRQQRRFGHAPVNERSPKRAAAGTTSPNTTGKPTG